MTLCFKESLVGHASCRGSSIFNQRLQVPAQRQRIKLGRILRLDTYNFRGDSLGSQDFAAQGGQRLAMSLFTKVANLPPHGKNITAEDERRQKESLFEFSPLYVWEAKCKACAGCGTVRTFVQRGRRTLGVCLKCEGVGFVRHISNTMDEDAPDFTLARPGSVIGPYCDWPQKSHLRNGH